MTVLSSINIFARDFTGAFSPDPAARKAVAWDIHKAGRETGFFYLTGHGVPDETMARQLMFSRLFFEQPLDRKLEIRMSNSPHMRGYDPIGRQALDVDSPPDIKESLMLGRDLRPDHPLIKRGIPFEGPNQWPAGIPGFQSQMEAYTAEMIRLCRRLRAGEQASPPWSFGEHIQDMMRRTQARPS